MIIDKLVSYREVGAPLNTPPPPLFFLKVNVLQ